MSTPLRFLSLAFLIAACRRDQVVTDAGAPAREAAAVPVVTPPPGRAIAPAAGTVTSLARPTLRTTRGVPAIELCHTRACESPQRVDVGADGRAALTFDLEPGTWFWRALPDGAPRSLIVREPSSHSSRVHGFDANGDGIADVAIEASLLLGSSGPLAKEFTRVPLALLDGAPAPAAMTLPRTYVVPVGDIDGDGYDDAVVESHVLRGGPVGLRPVAEAIACPEGGCGDAAGDLNDDGYADLVKDGKLQLGSPNGLRIVDSPLTAGAEEIRATPDLDGDGIADLAILTKGRASLAVVRGGASGLTAGATANMALPKGEDASVDLAVGDVDGDGTNDFVVLTDRTVIVRSTPAGGDISRSAERRIEVPADAQLSIADIDGDGFDDIVLFYGGPHRARARVIRGGKSALRLEPESIGWAPKDDINGFQLLPVGDINADGRDDLVLVGLPSAGFMKAYAIHSGFSARPFAEYTMGASNRVPSKK